VKTVKVIVGDPTTPCQYSATVLLKHENMPVLQCVCSMVGCITHITCMINCGRNFENQPVFNKVMGRNIAIAALFIHSHCLCEHLCVLLGWDAGG